MPTREWRGLAVGDQIIVPGHPHYPQRVVQLAPQLPSPPDDPWIQMMRRNGHTIRQVEWAQLLCRFPDGITQAYKKLYWEDGRLVVKLYQGQGRPDRIVPVEVIRHRSLVQLGLFGGAA